MKKSLFIFFVELYIFIFLGLVLHTSLHPQIFGKYTIKYFIFLVFLSILFWPYIKFIQFSLRRTALKFKKKKVLLTPFRKFEIYFLVFIFLLLLPTEAYLRYNNIKYGDPTKQSNFAYLIFEDFHPFLQHQNVKKDNERLKDLHINSYGFRGEEIEKKKPTGTYRIFLLGGSTALNSSTSYEGNSARVLEKMLRDHYKDKKIEVLNAGADGYTTEHSLIQYLFKIKDFDPDLIIMYHGINDMNASCTPNADSYGPYQPDYSNKFSALYNMVFDYYKPKPLFNFISYDYAKHFVIGSLYSDITNRFRDINASPIKKTDKAIIMPLPSIDSYKRNLKSMIDSTQADGVSLIIGNQPYLFNKNLDKKIVWKTAEYCRTNNAYPSVDSMMQGLNKFNGEAKTVAEENNVIFIDLESKIPKTLDYFIDDVHFIEKGNKIVAEEFYKAIITNSLIQ